MFGDTAVKRNKYLRLIVHLTPPQLEPEPASGDGMERLTGDLGQRRVLDLDVPLITLQVMPGRNLAVLTEAATRMHILRAKGEIGRAHVLTPVTNAHLVCRLLLEKKKT